jgi:hypothetical protein
MSDFEAWLAFRKGENPGAERLPCICCDRWVTKQQSVPGMFGNVECVDLDIGTICNNRQCRLDAELPEDED